LYFPMMKDNKKKTQLYSALSRGNRASCSFNKVRQKMSFY